MSVLHVELLTKARERVECGLNIFTCDALNAVSVTEAECAAALQIRKHINILIEYRFCLLSWLREHHGVRATRHSPKLKRTRLAWIDWLIEEWRDAP